MTVGVAALAVSVRLIVRDHCDTRTSDRTLQFSAEALAVVIWTIAEVSTNILQ